MPYNPKSLQNLRKPFQKGQVANPKGKGAGTRDTLQRSFLKALAEDFEEHGISAIQAARQEDPMGYIRLVASLIPREVEVQGPLEGVSDDELADMIEYLRSMVGPATN